MGRWVGRIALMGITVALVLAGGAALAQWDPPDEFSAEVIGNDVKITHRNVFYNCGIAGIEFELTAQATGTIAVTETAVEGEPADCYCHFVASFHLWNVAPGDWIVCLSYLEWPEVEWVTVEIPFTIADPLPDDPLQIGAFENSDCLEFSTPVPDDARLPVTWSALKVWYR